MKLADGIPSLCRSIISPAAHPVRKVISISNFCLVMTVGFLWDLMVFPAVARAFEMAKMFIAPPGKRSPTTGSDKANKR